MITTSYDKYVLRNSSLHTHTYHNRRSQPMFYKKHQVKDQRPKYPNWSTAKFEGKNLFHLSSRESAVQ